MESDLPRSRIGAVLFACNFNRVRSPMAEALLRRFANDRIYVDSCGVRMDPRSDGEGVDPFVEAVMAELSCDLGDYKPKTFADLEDGSFDLVVSSRLRPSTAPPITRAGAPSRSSIGRSSIRPSRRARVRRGWRRTARSATRWRPESPSVSP
jgi:hypothetical protein